MQAKRRKCSEPLRHRKGSRGSEWFTDSKVTMGSKKVQLCWQIPNMYMAKEGCASQIKIVKILRENTEIDTIYLSVGDE